MRDARLGAANERAVQQNHGMSLRNSVPSIISARYRTGVSLPHPAVRNLLPRGNGIEPVAASTLALARCTMRGRIGEPEALGAPGIEHLLDPSW